MSFLRVLRVLGVLGVLGLCAMKIPNLDKPEINSNTYEFLCHKRNEIHC
jgi:hypothetical protein